MLSRVTVLDMTEGVAGPYAASLLGDMGARVIKIERPDGDWQRHAGKGGAEGIGTPQFVALNRNKRDVGIDLGSAGGRSIAERLVAQADVVLSNYRAGVMAKLGFDYDRCKTLKPDIIYCTISGFGQEGPHAQRPASDTVLQALSGVMSVVGDPGGPPLRVGFPLIDLTAANHAVQAILLALYGRASGEGGANIDVSLMAAAATLIGGGYADYLATGRVMQRQGNQNALHAPAGAYAVAGGRYISVAVLRDSHWQKFCAAITRDDLAGDARFVTNALRLQHRGELDQIVQPLFATQTAEYWIERLTAADILCGPINTVADVLTDPKLSACLPLMDSGLSGVPRVLGAPIRYDGAYLSVERAAPAQGQHTREVLAEFGFTPQEIDTCLRDGSAFESRGIH